MSTLCLQKLTLLLKSEKVKMVVEGWIIMKLTCKELKNKIMGCRLGKNAGVILNAPYGVKRGINDVTDYERHYAGIPPPNDLQLVWINAATRFGKNVDASILGEYRLSYIIPAWVDYRRRKQGGF